MNIQAGDLVIRRAAERGFLLLEAMRLTPVSGPFEYFNSALVAALARRPHAVWQQSVDDRGRLMGDPVPLPLGERASSMSATSLQPSVPLAPAVERLAVLNGLHETWTNDLNAAVGVSPDLADAIAQALHDLKTDIRYLESYPPTD